MIILLSGLGIFVLALVTQCFKIDPCIAIVVAYFLGLFVGDNL